MKNILAVFLSAVFFVSAPVGPAQGAGVAKASLLNAAGEKVGYAVITEGDVVAIAYNLAGLPPGMHAFHIHGAGLCEPPFKSAGGHFNPWGREHGLKNPKGPHAGDMVNIVVGPDGTASGVRYAPAVTLAAGKKNSLFREGGTAIVIHAGPDDYVSDPAGAAGARIACGIIRKAGQK